MLPVKLLKSLLLYLKILIDVGVLQIVYLLLQNDMRFVKLLQVRKNKSFDVGQLYLNFFPLHVGLVHAFLAILIDTFLKLQT
jgi:hypothetical protein